MSWIGTMILFIKIEKHIIHDVPIHRVRHEIVKQGKGFVVPACGMACGCCQNLSTVINRNVVCPGGVRHLETYMRLAKTILNTFKHNVSRIGASDGSWESSHWILWSMMFRLVTCCRWPNVLGVQYCTPKLDERVEEHSDSLLTDWCILRQVKKSPTYT